MKSLLFATIVGYILFLPLPAYPWDNTGHRLIANIAYTHLTPTTRLSIDQLTETLDPGYPPRERFLYISTLPDKWRNTGENNGKIPHFIDIPWSTDGTPTLPATTPNLVTNPM